MTTTRAEIAVNGSSRPEYHPGTVGQPGRFYRLWHRLRGYFDREIADRSAFEQSLAEELARTAAIMNSEADLILVLRKQIRQLEDEVEVLKKNVILLSEVHEMDRARIKADTAAFERSAATKNE